MEKTGWEHADLEKEMATSNTAQLLELFKRETEKYNEKSSFYFHSQHMLTDEGRKELEEEAHIIDEGRKKIALAIVEVLTDTKRVVKK